MTPRPMMAILDGISTRKDGTLKVTLETNELHTEDSVYLMQNVNKQGYFYFQEAPFKEINIPEVKLNEFETKSHSQRLRNVLWLIWEANGKKGDFDTYYKSTMEKIIDQLKEKLN